MPRPERPAPEEILLVGCDPRMPLAGFRTRHLPLDGIKVPPGAPLGAALVCINGPTDHRVVARLRRRLGPQVPILALAPTDADDAVERAIRAGADCYIPTTLLHAPGGLAGFVRDFLDASLARPVRRN